MMFRSTVLLAVVGFAHAGIKPEVHIGVAANDKLSYTGGFEPSVKWDTEGTFGDYDYEAGVNMRAKDLSTADVPFGIWGSLRRTVGAWDVKVKAAADSDDLHNLDVKVTADGGPTDCVLRATGTVDAANQSGEVRTVGLTQTFEAPGGDLKVSPNYDVVTKKADIRAVYEIEDTKITIDADMDKQKVTFAQRLDEENEIIPSITSDGDVEVGYRRVVGDGVVTATYRPNDSTHVKYEEGPWVATADIPMDGFYKVEDGAKVSFRRSVTVEAS